MILNYKGWTNLKEQQKTKTVRSVWTDDPKSVEILSAFTSKFIPSIIGDISNLTVGEYTQALQKINDQQLATSGKFFADLGYSQPNPAIQKFQEDLMQSTEFSTFTTPSGEQKKFNDGIFGIATGRAILAWAIQKYKKIDPGKSLKDLGKQFGHAQSGEETKWAQKVETPTNIPVGVDTQKVAK